VDHIFLPLEHIQCDLSPIPFLAALYEIEEQNNLGVVDIHINLLDEIDEAVAIVETEFGAKD
jgi:hypothetical protein